MIEIFIGLLGGIFIGATGAGVGLIVSPLLILAGYRPAVAVGTGIGVLVAAKLVGSAIHHQLGHWPGRATWVLIAGGAGGVTLTWIFAAMFLPHWGLHVDIWVQRLLGVALLAVPFIFVLSSRKESQLESGAPHARSRFDLTQRPAAMFAVGMAVGAPVLVTSMGSGSILVPALLVVTDWEVPQLAAASNWFGLVVGAVSVGVHLHMGNLQAGGFSKVALGILPGVALGAYLSRLIGRTWFVYGMAGMSLLLGARLLFG